MINAFLNNADSFDLISWSQIRPFAIAGLFVWAFVEWGRWIWHMQKEGMRTGKRIKF